MTGQYLECEGAKNLNIEKIIFKFVQIKFLAIHITNQKLCFDIFREGNMIFINKTSATYGCFCAPGSHYKQTRYILDRIMVWKH